MRKLPTVCVLLLFCCTTFVLLRSDIKESKPKPNRLNSPSKFSRAHQTAAHRDANPQTHVADSQWIDFFSFVPHRITDCEDLFADQNKSDPFSAEYTRLIAEHEAFISGYEMEEGFSFQSVEETLVMLELVRLPFVRTICETGFNAGHSALLWLSAKPNTVLYSFDLGEHKYARPVARWLMGKYHDRFHIAWGHSEQTVPHFRARYPDVKCDLVIIDGGHFYEPAKADFDNFYKMAGADNVVVMDDYPVDIERCMTQLGKVWEEGKRTGKVMEIFNCKHKELIQNKYIKGFSIGRYNKG